MAKDIWNHPQIAYEETYAATLQMNELEAAGFSVQAKVAGIETAFVAEYGSGKPILGVMGEYDALPGLSQAVSPTYKPLEENGPGHGCGHNLLGTAGVAAVLALKEQMNNGEISGTVRYYGCPAEEVLSGKSFMARAGVFDDLDCVLTWHPSSSNVVVNMSMQSAASIKFHFKGVTAHAAGAPHAGRSALDAVEIMNVGANYLREHVVDGTRIHYVITDGGLAPNVVPEEATVWYYVRGASKEAVEEVLERVKKCADGAATMTETNYGIEPLAFCYETLPNRTLNELMLENMTVPASLFTEEERVFAQGLVDTVAESTVKEARRKAKRGEDDLLLPIKSHYFKDLAGVSMAGSSDIGDVSYIAPMGQIMTTCYPVGLSVHTWQATASHGSSIGMKGMGTAARVMALSLYDLFTKPELVEQAQEEFNQATEGRRYECAIPDDVKPVASKQDKSLIMT